MKHTEIIERLKKGIMGADDLFDQNKEAQALGFLEGVVKNVINTLELLDKEENYEREL